MDYFTFLKVYAACLLGLFLVLLTFVFFKNTFHRSVEKLNSYGLELLGCNHLDEAIEVFRKASQLNPYCARSHSNLAWALCRKNEHLQEAMEEFNTAIKLEPLNAIHFYRRGQFYLSRMNDILQSGRDFKRACEIEQIDNITLFLSDDKPERSTIIRSDILECKSETGLQRLEHRNNYAWKS